MSRNLKKLMEYKLVECLNPDKKVGRLQILTDLGEKVLEYAKNKYLKFNGLKEINFFV